MAWRRIFAYARPSRLRLHVDDSDWIADDHGFMLLLSETPQLESLHLVVQVSYNLGIHPDTLGQIDALVSSRRALQ